MNTVKMADINNSLVDSSQKMWNGLVDYLPALVLTVVILVVGLVLAFVLGSLTTKIVKGLQVDKILSTFGIREKLKKYDIDFSISGIFGWLVKWFVIFTTLFTVADILDLQNVSEFLSRILAYIPNVLVAVVILTLGLIVANFLAELVDKSISTTDFLNKTSVRVLKAITKWIVILFSVMVALTELNIATQLIQIFFSGIVMMFSLAGGIAFGLGGKDKAKELVDKIFSEEEESKDREDYEE